MYHQDNPDYGSSSPRARPPPSPSCLSVLDRRYVSSPAEAYTSAEHCCCFVASSEGDLVASRRQIHDLSVAMNSRGMAIEMRLCAVNEGGCSEAAERLQRGCREATKPQSMLHSGPRETRYGLFPSGEYGAGSFCSSSCRHRLIVHAVASPKLQTGLCGGPHSGS